MAMRAIEVERRFPVIPAVFDEVEEHLQKIKVYENIIDTYYIFNLLKRVMVRARSAEQIYPPKDKGKVYQLCAKYLFSPEKLDSLFDLNEINVRVDDFENLTEIFNIVKEEEFTIKGNRRYYLIPQYSGSFSNLIITTDIVDNLHHKYWIEIEILLDETTKGRYHEAIEEIGNIALKGFGIKKDYIRNGTVFPIYPEIYFWENCYLQDWTKTHGKTCKEFNHINLKK